MGVQVAIAGASGYAGAELLRLLNGHPEFEVVWAGAAESAGKTIVGQAPGLFPMGEERFDSIAEGLTDGIDLLFMALPPGESMAFMCGLPSPPKWVVDLGGDFRHGNPETFEKWYGISHACPEDLANWDYGLPEWNRARIADSDRVANPGCYPTAALLALLPLAKYGLLEGGTIYVDGKSGYSGAGRALQRHLAFSEGFGDLAPYSVGGHRHHPEIRDQLAALGSGDGGQWGGAIAFVPHLVPIARGLLDTCIAPVVAGTTQADIDGAFGDAYRDEPFVNHQHEPPHSKAVTGSNSALTSASLDPNSGCAIAICAIDNLVKGAAGQAIQNANLMVGLPETTGLPLTGIWP